MGDNNVLGIGAGQAALNTASGIVGQTIGRIFAPRDRQNQLEQQAKLNEQAYDINNRMAEANYERQMRMWEATNYQAQKEQLQKAGLNPGLLYGMGGGGGATAGATGGQGVGAGQAESSRQGMGIEPMNIMQLQILKAQKENIEADTKNKLSTNPNIGLEGQLLSENIVKQRLDNAYAGGTLEQRIANISIEASKLMAEARKAGTEANIAGATQEDQIKQIEANAAGAVLQNEAIKMGLKVSEQQIKESIARIRQAWKALDIQDRAQKTQAFKTEVEANYPGLFDVLGKSINDIVNAITEKAGGGRAEDHRTEKQK